MSVEESFKLMETHEMPAAGMTARLYMHTCGLQVMSIECADVENMFSIGISTVPEDNTGTPHIIEHSVLSGSGKYPVRDPFMEMIKGSVATFINAITYREHTVYPVSSTVPKDFFNLASVYFDAVFNPLMTRHAFEVEGWHYEFEKAGDLKSRLKRNGIVLNEMSGAMADIDELIAWKMNDGLVPCTPRRFVSGGVPENIPDLSYENYRKYYLTHYHPSNARIFLYGNIPTEEKLAFIDRSLSELKFWDKPKERRIRRIQRHWKHSRHATVRYMPGFSDDAGAWAKSWLLSDDWDLENDMAFELLDILLLENDSSPLRKAIQESGLCDGICISGYDNETLETAFLVAVNGIEAENCRKLEVLVDSCLADVAAHGFAEKDIEAALMQFRASQLDVSSNYVYRVMEKVFDAWCNGKNPFMFLDNAALLDRVEARIRNDKDWLAGLVQNLICNNCHSLTIRFQPDAGYDKKCQRENAAGLDRLKKSLSIDKLNEIDKNAAILKQLQDSSNSVEAIATLPKLMRKDVPKAPYFVRHETSLLDNGCRFVEADCHTNGLVHLNFELPLGDIPQPLLMKMTALYRRLFAGTGTQGKSYAQNASDFALTGAVMSYSPRLFCPIGHPGEINGVFDIQARLPEKRLALFLQLLEAYIRKPVFDDDMIVRAIVSQTWSSLREDFAGGSSSNILERSMSGINAMGMIGDAWNGVTAAGNIGRLARRFAKAWPSAKRKLEQYAVSMSNVVPVAVGFAGSDSARNMVLDFASSFKGAVPNTGINCDFTAAPCRTETIAVSSDVSAFVRSFVAPGYEQPDSVPLGIYANALSCGVLWNELRLKGGCYETSASYRPYSGVLSLCTGQDPNPAASREFMDKIPGMGVEIENMEGAVLSTIKGFFAPMRPDRAVASSVFDCLSGVTDQLVMERFENYMALKLSDVKEAVERYWASAPAYCDCAIGPAAAVNAIPSERIVL